jgi:hypothetical protein
MSSLTKLWRWCHGYTIETYKTIETLPGGWKSYSINMDDNSDPNEPMAYISLGGI